MNSQSLKLFLKEHNLQPLKSLGQNFLVHPPLIQQIVQELQKKTPPYVEIGPGAGALTRHFDKKSCLLVEKDKKIAQYWKDRSWRVLAQDALKVKKWPLAFTLFGNLPYQIAGSLIIKMSVQSPPPQNMLFLIQKEVADRLKAGPRSHNYGLLTVIAQNFWDISDLFFVPKNYFYPQPQVDGQVLQFQAKKPLKSDFPAFPDPDFPKNFLQFVKQCFHQKRKMLYKKILSQEPKKQLKILGFSENCRAEELSPKDFIRLYKQLKTKA